MTNDSTPTSAGESRTGQTFRRLRQTLTCLLPAPSDEITPTRSFAALIPVTERRRVWQELRREGLELPGLGLSGPVFLAVAAVVLLPLALLALLVKSWSVFWPLGELGLVAHRLTRPWAVHPPLGCETVQEAALQLTPFQREDYQAGLWPREDIAAKVRLIVAEATNTPFADVTDQTRLNDICC